MKQVNIKSVLAVSIILAISGCASNTKSNILTPTAITASSHDGNGPDRLFDQDITTRWSANGTGE